MTQLDAHLTLAFEQVDDVLPLRVNAHPPRVAFANLRAALGRTAAEAIGSETVAILRTHRKQQRELIWANKNVYQNFDLVFAKEHQDLRTPKAQLGEPCLALVGGHFTRVMQAAGVKTIGVHGMRHTCATLLLADGELHTRGTGCAGWSGGKTRRRPVRTLNRLLTTC